jgi:hypothetical protein
VNYPGVPITQENFEYNFQTISDFRDEKINNILND